MYLSKVHVVQSMYMVKIIIHQTLIQEHRDVFSMGYLDLGYYTGVKHYIRMTDDQPFK